MKKLFAFTLEEENIKKIREIAKKRNQSVSDFVDSVLEDFLFNKPDSGGEKREN
jgi:predicted DNA-binding ribbon-helix-helix protein